MKVKTDSPPVLTPFEVTQVTGVLQRMRTRRKARFLSTAKLPIIAHPFLKQVVAELEKKHSAATGTKKRHGTSREAQLLAKKLQDFVSHTEKCSQLVK